MAALFNLKKKWDRLMSTAWSSVNVHQLHKTEFQSHMAIFQVAILSVSFHWGYYSGAMESALEFATKLQCISAHLQMNHER